MNVFIARQPIFDRMQEVIAYELLGRTSFDNYFAHQDPDRASSSLIGDSSLFFGLDKLIGNKKAFINITKNSLLREYPLLLPKDRVVIELLETVDPTREVLAKVRQLKDAGYIIALDDFEDKSEYLPLLEMADIIKIDFLQLPMKQCRNLAKTFGMMGKKLVAEKVETRVAHGQAIRAGYHYFQGFYFAKPVVLSNRNITGNRANYMRILREIHSPGIDFHNMEKIIKADVALSYKLLRYINSAVFAWRKEIRGIHHALVLLGEDQVRKWATLVTLATIGEGHPPELMINATVRAKFCEDMAPKIGQTARAADLFILGLFSQIDAILSRPLKEVLDELPLSEELEAALMGSGESVFRHLLDTIKIYEQADWERLPQCAELLKVDEEEIPNCYLEAVSWVDRSFQNEQQGPPTTPQNS